MMFGRRSDSRALQVVGVAVAAIAVVGSVAFGWDFSGFDDGIVPVALGVGALVLAVGATLYRRHA
jgi:hypothetical protein